MHLEGFRIERDHINCFFNLSLSGLRELINSNEILQKLKTPINHNVEVYFKYAQKRYTKYKYHFNFLIHHKISTDSGLRRYIIPVIAKEISEDVNTLRYWFDLSKDSEVVIPTKQMKQLEIIFNLNADELKNKLDN